MAVTDLGQARSELGAMVFSQEYLAEFVDMGGQIFRREWLRYCDIDGSGVSSVAVTMDGWHCWIIE